MLDIWRCDRSRRNPLASFRCLCLWHQQQPLRSHQLWPTCASAHATAMSSDACANPTELTSGDLIGLTVTTEAGLLSAGAILVIVCLIIRRTLCKANAGASTKIVNTHVDIYMISLLVSDMLQAIGAVLDIRWIRRGSVSCGGYCTAQGIIQSIGEPSVAMAVVVIAIHTFFVIFFRWSPPRSFLIPCLIVGAIWLYVSLYVSISYARHHTPGTEYFIPTPYWCWISSRYPNDRISEEYFWLWFAALFSIVLYIPLFLVIRGNIEVDPGKGKFWKISFHRTQSVDRAGYTFSPSRQSMKMLLYPASYVLIVLPLTITRWIGFSNGNKIAPFWTFFGVSIYGLSGIANVLLLTLTRPSILSFGTLHGTSQYVSKGRTNATLQNATSTFPFAPGNRAQDPADHTLSVEVHVERNMYEDIEPDTSSIKSPSLKSPDSGAPLVRANTGSMRISPLPSPSPAYQLQDMRGRKG